MGNIFNKIFNNKNNTIYFKNINKNIEILNQIGFGGFSSVFLCKDPSTENKFALKRLNCPTQELEKFAKNEINMFRTVNHENILKLIDCSLLNQNNEKIYFLLLPLFGKNGEDIINNRKNENSNNYKAMQQGELLEIFLKISNALAAIHEKNLTHRDIKPANILFKRISNVNHQDDVVLMDFGSVGELKPDVSTSDKRLSLQDSAEELCSILYRAPELFEIYSNTLIDSRIDVWSLGCTFYHFMFGFSPFEAIYSKGDSVKLAACNMNFSFPENHKYTDGLISLIKRMLQSNPDDRIFLEEVIEEIELLLNPKQENIDQEFDNFFNKKHEINANNADNIIINNNNNNNNDNNNNVEEDNVFDFESNLQKQDNIDVEFDFNDLYNKEDNQLEECDDDDDDDDNDFDLNIIDNNEFVNNEISSNNFKTDDVIDDDEAFNSLL
eukprot:TRINITY_DN3204_c0_g2_i3.p1 TRINITY_DN3204_c0_g2~~TRINITY_DN3204_c0_g2_i3.p1  ORF type:complete len:440 (-),score=138.66 TRINITY_DN3204_c0_g2_i3:143-1462(-)